VGNGKDGKWERVGLKFIKNSQIQGTNISNHPLEGFEIVGMRYAVASVQSLLPCYALVDDARLKGGANHSAGRYLIKLSFII